MNITLMKVQLNFMKPKSISILGTRGVPAQHGGFETFAEHLSLYLVKKGWEVIVYCQTDDKTMLPEDTWNGIVRRNVYSPGDGALSTVIFDFKVALLSINDPGVQLLLGYNTAIFNVIQRFARQPLLINMDGIEWKREKWGVVAKTWFWLNEKAGSYIGNHLIADHPKIKEHLQRNVSDGKITMIPYGAYDIDKCDSTIVEEYGLISGGYSIIIARAEPENSILEMVTAFSEKFRGHKLVVLGNYIDTDSFHQRVKTSASDEVLFFGAIYDSKKVDALRKHAYLYLHGHKVGGTNPSLVEAMGAGCAVLAHDNHFNRWVVGSGGKYFKDVFECSELLDNLLNDDGMRCALEAESKKRFLENFTWDVVLQQYEELILKFSNKELK